MRNYVIINGVNSLTIQGLAINILPPISKPPMRTLREEIDGRDGDITTELGYGAYDRTLEIGLFGNYDINEVIAFFNSKGTIVFSDEDDKYYNFEITDRIDYSKLVKFRTASINIHCQPFKYPLNETPLEEEYEYVEGEGTELTLNDTANAIFNKFDLLGQTSQTGTPTPSSPISVNVVSGDNEINICGKNLFNKNTITTSAYLKEDGTLQTGTGAEYVTSDFIPVQPNTTYYKTQTLSPRTKFYDANKQPLNTTTYQDISIGGNAGSFTTPSNAYYFRFTGNVNVSTGININTTMIHKGSTSTTYEPYIGNTYPIYLGVENLLQIKTDLNTTQNGLQFKYEEDGAVSITGTANATSNYYIPLQSNIILDSSTHTFSCKCEGTIENNISSVRFVATGGISFGNTSKTLVSNSQVYITSNDTNSSEYKFCLFSFTNGKSYNIKLYFQLEKGSKANSYSAYGTTPIELCKIGTYQDYIYKEGTSWYLHKEIGKVVLDGSESWETATSSQSFTAFLNRNIISDNSLTTLDGYCDYYKVQTNEAWNYMPNNSIIIGRDTRHQVLIRNDSITTLADFKTWLGNNNTSAYYILATPTNTLIEDTTLISQLDDIDEAVAYDGQTNISQENNDLGIWLVVKALKKNSDRLIIDNIGNIYSKPTLDLEGNGIVDIYLNGSQAFQVDLTDINEIIISTQEMEAYNPTTNALANRKVVGDYSKFKLNVGENELRFSGALTKATITYYQRWL